MENSDSIFGCFVSGPALYYHADDKTKELSREKGEYFREFIWGKNMLRDRLKRLNFTSYGNDIVLVLFQFTLNPLVEELPHLKEIERFRPKEKSVGIPIIIDDSNFFTKERNIQINFLKDVIMQRLELLEKLIRRNKFDTDILKLKKDTQETLENFN